MTIAGKTYAKRRRGASDGWRLLMPLVRSVTEAGLPEARFREMLAQAFGG